jgi:anti-sigma B factor antagonist
MEFGYKIADKGNYVLVSLKGDLIEKNQANELMEEVGQLADTKESNFVIDLGDFRYMNSTGLNVMLGILSRARKSGGEAVICSVPEKINSLLVITKLVNVFSVVENEEAAARTFSAV